MFKTQLLEGNLSVIKKVQPKTWEWLVKHLKMIEELKRIVIKNRYGLPDIKLSSGYLMEEINLIHYKNWIKRVKKSEVMVLVGSSLGYGVNLLMRSDRRLKLIVVEPEPYMLLATLGVCDYREMILNRKLWFCSSMISHLSLTFERFIPYILHSKIQVLLDWVNLRLGKEYKEAFKRVSDVLNDLVLSLSTVKRRQEETVRNEIRNFSRIFSDGSLLGLKGKLKGFLCTIVGAGPSLTEQIKALKMCKNRIIIATAFQTTPALFRFNIKPTVNMALDYTKDLLKVYEKVDKEWLKDIPLIYSPKVDPEVLSRYPGITIPVWTTGGLGTHVNPQMDLVIESGGNVSVALIRLMYEFGITRFILIGQDFCWQKDKTHCEGHHASEKKFEFDPEKYIKTKNVQGETVFTAGPYLCAVHEIEKDIEEKNLKIYNLSNKGIKIENSKSITLNEFKLMLDGVTQDQEAYFLNLIKTCRFRRNPPKLKLETDIWYESLNNVEKRLKKLYKKHQKHQKEIKSVYNEILVFLNQHPVYSPYLQNDMLQLLKFSTVKDHLLPSDLRETSRILKDIKTKIKELDKELKNLILLC